MRLHRRPSCPPLAAALLLAVALSGCRSSGPSPDAAAADAVAALSALDPAALAALADPSTPVDPAVVERFRDDAGVVRAEYRQTGVERDGDRATVRVRGVLDLRGLGRAEHDGAVQLSRSDGRWRLRWSSTALHPALEPGRRIVRTRTRPERAPILGVAGEQLAGPLDVVTVGLAPDRVTDRAAVLAGLALVEGVDQADVVRDLDRAGPTSDQLVPVVDLRPERYAALRPQLAPIPGIVFRRTKARLAPTDGFARTLLGRTGEATAEALERLGPSYQAGDRVGLSGLERALEPQLAGTPTGTVTVVGADGTAVATLLEVTGTAPAPLRTTLSADAQLAAERALDGVAQPAAIVAVDAATGQVRAVVSRPTDQADRALAGRYPPGSTAKVLTAYAALTSGRTPGSPLSCPPTATVGGKPFKNFRGEAASGPVDLATATASSCNTAYVQLADQLPAEAVRAAAATFGFGADPAWPVPARGGSFPEPRDAAERAAAAIGQGRVEASPLHMATVAAAAATGTWRPPTILQGQAAPEAIPLDAAATTGLQQLLRAVVASGSGRAADRPGGPPVIGKTGTAEFGTPGPDGALPTHAWFIGARAGLAVAVLVEAGGVGGEVAAPVAGRFFAAVGP